MLTLCLSQVLHEFLVLALLSLSFGLNILLIVDRLKWMNAISHAIPDAKVLKEVGTAIVDEKIKEFGFASSPTGGRPAEGLAGLAERFLMTPLGQQIAGGLAQKYLGAGVGGKTDFGV